MILTQLAIAGSVTYAGLHTYQQNRKKKSLGQLLAADSAAVTPLPRPNAATAVALPAHIADLIETFHHTHIAPRFVQVSNAVQDLAWYPTLPAFLQDTHRQQLAQLSADGKIELSEREREENRHIAVSLVALGITSVATLAHSPLIIASVPFLGYLYIPMLKNLYYAIQEKQYVLLRSLDTIIVGGELIGGFFLATSMASTLYFIAERALVKAEIRSRQSLINVFGNQPRSAWVLTNGAEVQVDCERLQAGDIVVVHAGESIPVDGTIVQGIASIDQHMLTGEAQPVEKGVGEQVLAPTIVLSGKLHIQVERAGRETTAAQIGDILNNTAAFKDRVELESIAFVERFIVPTLLLGAASFPFVGANRALAILESSFGYNLRVSGPMSMLNLLQIAARQGILIKEGQALRVLPQVDTVVFDKTGTLTLEQPHVGVIHTFNGLSKQQVLAWAATAEYRQTHPIARAILAAAQQQGIELSGIDTAEYKIGYGIKVTLNDHTVCVGSSRFLAMEEITLPEEVALIQHGCYEQGYSLVLVALDGLLVGAIELHPTIRPEARDIIQQLKQRGLTLYIISGDHEQPTQRLAHSLGIDHYIAEVLPQNKATHVEQLQQAGSTVCFVGDGINDSIALQQANLSVSMRGASTAATDTAQVVLMDGSLRHLVSLLDLGNEYQTNMRGNKLMATIPSVVCIGGVYILKWGVVTTIMLYNISLAASLGNAFLPLLMRQLKGNGGTADDVIAPLPSPPQIEVMGSEA